jgi:hypothetical protein
VFARRAAQWRNLSSISTQPGPAAFGFKRVICAPDVFAEAAGFDSFPADRGREMGKVARIHAKKNYCANDVIPQYERYYQRVLDES